MALLKSISGYVSKMRGFFHFIMAVTAFIVISSALSAEFFFSKEAIMDSMQFSLSEVGVLIYPVDQLFIARMMRRAAWDWHFYTGLVMSISYIGLLAIACKSKTSLLWHKVFGLQVVLMASTGLVLKYRYFEILATETISMIRSIHYLMAFMFILTIATHLITIYRSHKRKEQ